MEWLKAFSADYGSGITAIAALGILVLALASLWYLRREYAAKYRPYVVPMVHVEPIAERLGCLVSIAPANVGNHPCQVKLTNIRLHVGDHTMRPPGTKEWVLLAPHGGGFRMPAGEVDEAGVMNIREQRFRLNRIELAFVLTTAAVDGRYETPTTFIYEIDVRGERPQALLRPDWKITE